MEKVIQNEGMLTGLSFPGQTTNANGQSAVDCGMLWQEFEKGQYFDRIPDKLGQEILAVYHLYDGDHTQPYSYFIGCRTAAGSAVPEGLDSIVLPGGTYVKITAKGKMPDCVADTWRAIWGMDLPRAYTADFEVYDQRSTDWNNAEVEIYLSVR